MSDTHVLFKSVLSERATTEEEILALLDRGIIIRVDTGAYKDVDGRTRKVNLDVLQDLLLEGRAAMMKNRSDVGIHANVVFATAVKVFSRRRKVKQEPVKKPASFEDESTWRFSRTDFSDRIPRFLCKNGN